MDGPNRFGKQTEPERFTEDLENPEADARKERNEGEMRRYMQGLQATLNTKNR